MHGFCDFGSFIEPRKSSWALTANGLQVPDSRPAGSGRQTVQPFFYIANDLHGNFPGHRGYEGS